MLFISNKEFVRCKARSIYLCCSKSTKLIAIILGRQGDILRPNRIASLCLTSDEHPFLPSWPSSGRQSQQPVQ